MVAVSSNLMGHNNMPFDWFIPSAEEFVHIVFKNGNEYVGTVLNKMMDGTGVFVWDDGACYEGDFQNGEITGEGLFKYAECSYYQGQFCCGMLHGLGAFYPLATSMVYNGSWKYGKKHGKGWMLYETGDFYDGEWADDCREGKGYRQYLNGTVYSGRWKHGCPDGEGMIHFYNNDFYQGEWSKGQPHGYGEYTWKAGMARGLTLTIENRYLGSWVNGKREGQGNLYFGMEGSKLRSKFRANQKQGPGILVCGDGTTIQKNPLFFNDKPTQKPKMDKSQTRLSGFSHEPSSHSLWSKHDLNINKSSVNRMRMSKCFPTPIPIHGTAASININEHIYKLIQTYLKLIVEPRLMKQDPKTWRMSLVSGMELNPDYNVLDGISLEFEERKLRNAILYHYQILEDLYMTYASLTYMNSNIKPVLSRLLLWQMHRDLDVQKIGLSLIQIDNLLNNFPGSAITTKHSPFEKIYFWQFLHSIILICWEHYSSKEFLEKYKKSGIYAQMLKDFIKDFVCPNFGTFKGESLFKYKDLLPIQAVYSLYKSIGEPHTAKKFMRRCCTKKWEEPICYLRSDFNAEPVKIFCGKNTVYTNSNILYLPEDPPDFGEKPRNKCDCPFEKDAFYRDLKIFRSLGPKRVVACLCEVCPLIKKENLITYIDYELTFLEFHEVLLLLSLKFIAQIKKEEEKLLKTTDSEKETPRFGFKEDKPASAKKKLPKAKK